MAPTSPAGRLKGNTVNETRIKEDLLGAKEVPIGACYGIHIVRGGKVFATQNGSDVSPEVMTR